MSKNKIAARIDSQSVEVKTKVFKFLISFRRTKPPKVKLFDLGDTLSVYCLQKLSRRSFNKLMYYMIVDCINS